MREHHSNDIVWFQFESLLRLGERVTHGIFSRRGGVSLPPFASLNAGPATADDPAARMENYRRIAAVLPGHPLLVGTKPQQGSNLKEITAADLNADGKPAVLLPEGCDAFITKERGVGLFWAVADCSVVLLVDPEHRAIGLAHAGWRGTRDAIVAKTITAMRETYGTQPDALVAAIAPTIGTCCYEVDEQVRTAFRANPFANEHVHFRTLTTADATGAERQSLRLDLAASNRAQLLACGVQAEHIEMSDDCPGSHTELFFSHRMEGGHTGRFAVVLGLR
jgi:purine-nucleoside/S-methyl-5'-thioadenosine phosphorylase / adenosine deaminase